MNFKKQWPNSSLFLEKEQVTPFRRLGLERNNLLYEFQKTMAKLVIVF